MKAFVTSAPVLLFALAGCGAQIVPPPATGFQPASQPGQPILGTSASALIARFGEPRLDIRDPAARKLQFGNAQCVLDVYFYAPAERREPLASFAEARQAATGAAMPWPDCAKLLDRH